MEDIETPELKKLREDIQKLEKLSNYKKTNNFEKTLQTSTLFFNKYKKRK